MIYTKENPEGIDVPIQKLQTKLYNRLLAKWGISSDKYNSFGRCYRNQDEKGLYIPEFYSGAAGVEYTDTLMDDLIYCTSFFGVSETIRSLGGRTFQGDIHLIFCLNISKLKHSIAHRADEELHVDALNALRNSLPQDTITGIITGMDKVFQEYSGGKAQKLNMFNDMHPFHCFRINFELTFINNNC